MAKILKLANSGNYLKMDERSLSYIFNLSLVPETLIRNAIHAMYGCISSHATRNMRISAVFTI